MGEKNLLFFFLLKSLRLRALYKSTDFSVGTLFTDNSAPPEVRTSYAHTLSSHPVQERFLDLNDERIRILLLGLYWNKANHD